MNYTIGEVFRFGLLRNADGKPYSHKATVSRIINSSGYAVVKKTKHGLAKTISKKNIELLNKRWS